MVCYVTAYLDIGRSEWNTIFKRSFTDYLSEFLSLVNLFEKENNKGVKDEKNTDANVKDASEIDTKNDKNFLVIFIDKQYHKIVNNRVKNLDNCVCIPIDEKYMEDNIFAWSRIDKEREIMNSEKYKSYVSHKLANPEHNNEKYTLINHAKIDFVNLSIDLFPNFSHYCWVDFGFFSKGKIPQTLLDMNKLHPSRITYNTINCLDNKDKDPLYTLIYAPEKVAGGFFFGKKETLRKYQKLFHEEHKKLQEMGIVDDDQHLVLRCFFSNPELFQLKCLHGWRMSFLFYS